LLKRLLLVIITVLLVGSLTAPIVIADNLDKRIGIGIGNPYFGIKYGLSFWNWSRRYPIVEKAERYLGLLEGFIR